MDVFRAVSANKLHMLRANHTPLRMKIDIVAMALTVLLRLLDYTGAQLYVGGFLLFIVMVAPLFVLPMETWKGLLDYLRDKLKGSEQK